MTIIKKNQQRSERFSAFLDGGETAPARPQGLSPARLDEADEARDARARYADGLAKALDAISEATNRFVERLPELTGQAIRTAIGEIDARAAIESSVASLISKHRLQGPLTVHASPADAEALRELAERNRPDGAPAWRVKADLLLRDGEVVIECAMGRIQAGPRSRGEEIARLCEAAAAQ